MRRKRGQPVEGIVSIGLFNQDHLAFQLINPA